MIRMTAEIELLQGSGEINTESITISPSGNNISADVADVVGFRKAGSNPFLFGISKLGSGATYSGGEGYFIGSQAADAEGNFATPYTLTFSIDNLDTSNINFSILFDTYNNAYPNTIQGSVYADGAKVGDLHIVHSQTLCAFIYNGTISGSNIEFRITISDWSMPNYPLRIQGIYTGIKLYVDRRNMLSLSAPIKDRSDNEQPSYGIISNSGSLSLIDGTGEIKEYALMKLLKPDLDVQLTLEDTLTKKKQSIGKFKTYKWAYNNKNFNVDIELKDDMEQLQNNISDGMEKESNEMTFLQVYNWMVSETSSKSSNFIFAQLDNKTESVLSNIKCSNIFVNSGNLWEQFTKLCNIVGIHIYENANKEVIVSSDFGG